MNDELAETLHTLVCHAIQQVKDAHREGAIGWDEKIVVRDRLMEHETMTPLVIYSEGETNGTVMTLREWYRQVRNLRSLML